MTFIAIDFAKKLNTLTEVKTKRAGSKYTQEEVIQGTDAVLTRAYLWKLRTGRARNPVFYIVQALAGFFEVRINYFRVAGDQEKELLEKALRDKLVSQVALRLSMFSDETLLAILYRLEYIVKNRSEVGKSQKTWVLSPRSQSEKVLAQLRQAFRDFAFDKNPHPFL